MHFAAEIHVGGLCEETQRYGVSGIFHDIVFVFFIVLLLMIMPEKGVNFKNTGAIMANPLQTFRFLARTGASWKTPL